MNCEICFNPRLRPGRPAAKPGRAKTVPLQRLGVVECRTGNAIKTQCPVCRSIFFFDATLPQLQPA